MLVVVEDVVEVAVVCIAVCVDRVVGECVVVVVVVGVGVGVCVVVVACVYVDVVVVVVVE